MTFNDEEIKTVEKALRIALATTEIKEFERLIDKINESRENE